MRILIAEDERITRATLERQLKNWGHEVTAAEDGQTALDLYLRAEFDIVITDWEMPFLSGLELVKQIREKPRAAYTYVILLTSRSDKSDVVAGIEAGADDFVSKPFDREELRVRLLAGERVVKLERALQRQNVDLRDANQRIQQSLQAAARVQQSMLPKQNVVTSSVRTAWKYVPTDELAGDAIGIHLIDDRYVAAYVLDVSGHGVPAALLSVSAMHFLEPTNPEASLLRVAGGLNRELGSVQQPSRVVAELNRRFRAGENDGRFITMVLVVLDTHTGRVHMTEAGHPVPYVLRGPNAISVPEAGGLPISVIEDSEYDEAVLQLAPGDRICLFSDGLIEQTNAADDADFGNERSRDAFASRHCTPAEKAVEEITAELSAWAGGNSFTDDVSLVIVEWLGHSAGHSPS